MSPNERCLARVVDQSGWSAYQCNKRATTELEGAKLCGTHANVLRRRRWLDVTASSGGSYRTVRLVDKASHTAQEEA